MQKLVQRRKTNTPTDAPQVRSNCGLQLNKEETLSVASSKTCANNPDVAQLQQAGGLKGVVLVLSVSGSPLMPCTPAKARKLLRKNEATCIKNYPFIIKLNFECENVVQEVTMGLDTGFGNIGFSCVTENKELFSGEIKLDGKTSERLTERSMYRRKRRGQLWHRKPRFSNRKTNLGRLPPSTQRRYDTHLRIIFLLQQWLPISEVILEVGNFDIQKIENPDIAGIGYQQGDMYGYQNMRSYLMARENGLCQVCHEPFKKGQPSHIHHCLERSEGGSDKAKNLAILHKKCHEDLHTKGLKMSAPKSYKQSTFMSIIRNRFYNDIPNIKITYGYKTFTDRIALGLEKTHHNDAFVIAGGANQQRVKPIFITQKRKNNRALQLNRKGFKPSIRKQRHKIQPKDLVWIDGKKIYSDRNA